MSTQPRKKIHLLNHQHEFLTAKEKFVALIGGIGCLSADSILHTECGDLKISQIKKPMMILTPYGWEQGSVPFPLRKDDLYRVSHTHGEFVCAANHRIFSPVYGWIRVQDLIAGDEMISVSENLFHSIEESYQPKSSLDAQSYLRTIEGFLENCLKCIHQYDLLPLEAISTFQQLIPSIIDALKYIPYQSYKGDLSEQLSLRNHLYQQLDHLSSLDFFPHKVVQTLVLEVLSNLLLFQQRLYSSRVDELSQHFPFQKVEDELLNHDHIFLQAYRSNTTITKIVKEKNDWVWDIEILGSNSYICSNVVHHNSGKTWSGSHYSIQKVATNNKSLHFIGANTYSQLETATLKTLTGELEKLGIKYSYNQNKGLLEFAGGQSLCKTMDNYEMLRGIEVGSFWLDEVRDLKQQAFDMMMGRLRDKNATKLEGRVTSSPSGYNWIYDYFHPEGEKNNPEFKLINAASMSNIYLPEGYLDSIKAQYSDEFYEQEILGRFVRGGKGTVFPWIITALKIKREYLIPIDSNKWTMIVGLDPGSTSCFGVIFFLYNQYTKKIIVVDEIYEKNPSNTTAYKMNNAINEVLSKYSFKSVEFIYDEAAVWFKNELQEVDSSKWLMPSAKSRFGVDGYINLVKVIMNQGLLTIASECVNFWKELEMYQKDDNGRIPKENDHLINAFQYACGSLGLDFSESQEPREKPEEKRFYTFQEEFNKEESYEEFD